VFHPGIGVYISDVYTNDPGEERLGQIRLFKEEHGHTRVTLSMVEAPARLANWVANQRSHYNAKVTGKTHCSSGKKVHWITDERVRALEAFGFEWSLKGSNVSK
jgi:hypothetical protein